MKRKNKRSREELLSILRANHLRRVLKLSKTKKKRNRYYLALDKNSPLLIKL